MSAKVIVIAVAAVVAVNLITTAQRRAKQKRDMDASLKKASEAFQRAQQRQQSEFMSDRAQFMRDAGFGDCFGNFGQSS